MLMYHGTYRRYRALKRDRGTAPSTIGVWFASARGVAEKFGKSRADRFGDSEGCLVFRADVNLRNPKVYPTYAEFVAEWVGKDHDANRLRRSLQHQGHDGILIAKSDTDYGIERVDAAVFDPKRSLTVLDVTPCGGSALGCGHGRR